MKLSQLNGVQRRQYRRLQAMSVRLLTLVLNALVFSLPSPLTFSGLGFISFSGCFVYLCESFCSILAICFLLLFVFHRLLFFLCPPLLSLLLLFFILPSFLFLHMFLFMLFLILFFPSSLSFSSCTFSYSSPLFLSFFFFFLSFACASSFAFLYSLF